MNIGLVLLLALTTFKNKDTKEIKLLNNNFKTIDLNLPYTMEKINIMKKIGPYFPKEFIPSINKALMFTEKFIKLYETMEFMKFSEANYIQNTVSVENNQQRLSYIAETIKKESSKEKIDQMGGAIGMVLTMDRFNKLFQILESIMTNPDNLNDPSNIVKLMEPFMEGKDEKEKKQLMDMTKMIEIIKTLDTPKKSTKKEEKT
ncbi:hypothetical protein [Clostridium sp. Cult1]|uniref:hypothetical protein n=1 Tax=Clostridium sp. Cult1 TaxID=2079002 RepID=UPI001F43E7F5|nr:hypothetical protein [Clostridium sp. Cult1]MCF6461873.1 hypothetical protein [Clostridium sp. Cult1]